MAFTENIAEFMDTDTGFAENATYDGTATVAGFYGASPAESFDVVDAGPEFIVASGDIAADPRGRLLVLSAGTFTIREFDADLTGRLTTLKLEAV